MKKKVGFVILSFVMIGLSHQLIGRILALTPDSFSSIKTLLNSIGIGAYVTGIFAFVGFVLPTHRCIASGYYKIYKPKLLKRVYKYLGVDFFRKALLILFWGSKDNRKKYFNGTKSGLQDFIYETKQSEFGHLASLVVLIPVSILFLYNGFYLYALFTAIVNIIGNLYPVLLQRHHRIRVQRILGD